MTAWLDDLNPAQRQAVTHGDGPLLVVAGAGSGKTKTLACRVAYLIHQGVAPDRILLLTFTRRAAAEMLRRAEALAGNQTAGRVWGGTFHAISNRLLRIYGQSIGLASDFTVMDQSDAEDLMNLIRSEGGFARDKRRFPKKGTLLAIYSRAVNAREKLGQVLKSQFPWCADDAEALREIFKSYTQRKREQNVLDYDDLLLVWEKLAQTPGVGEAVGERFDHILVDEYQDTNAVQSDILRHLRRKKPSIMAVGDDAQSIYSFRAATIRNILDFPEHFPETTVVTLEQNYRSTKPILAASNAVMDLAKERHTKNLWSNRASSQKPTLVTCLDEQAQCNEVCDRILAHLEEGTPLMQQAVLFRASHHSSLLEVELARRNIPFHKYGGLKFIEAAHVKDVLALLRILENPRDEISWYRILLLMDGVGPRTAQRIMQSIGVRRATQDSAGDASADSRLPLRALIESPPSVPPAARESMTALRQMLGDCAGVALPIERGTNGGSGNGHASSEATDMPRAAPPLTSQFECIRRFYEPILHRVHDNATVRARDLEQLEHIAAGYKSRTRFIADLTLDPPRSTSDLAQPPFLEEDYLILSTIHSAKGCEWDVVHVIHAADGMIPSDMAVTDEAGVEEERRLLYVAMTRAKDRLHVYYPLRYYHRKHAFGDAHSYAQLTRFIPASVRAHFDEVTPAIERGGDDPMRATRVLGDVGEDLSRLWEE